MPKPLLHGKMPRYEIWTFKKPSSGEEEKTNARELCKSNGIYWRECEGTKTFIIILTKKYKIHASFMFMLAQFASALIQHIPYC